MDFLFVIDSLTFADIPQKREDRGGLSTRGANPGQPSFSCPNAIPLSRLENRD
jgi:hypothetical protein